MLLINALVALSCFCSVLSFKIQSATRRASKTSGVASLQVSFELSYINFAQVMYPYVWILFIEIYIIQIYVNITIYMYTYICICVHVYAFVCIVCNHIYEYIYTYMNKCMHTYVCICIYIDTGACKSRLTDRYANERTLC